jgi:SagB-type dehydrogenase family enzyme
VTPGDAARLYHRLSSYSYVPAPYDLRPIRHPLVLQDFVASDPVQMPPPTKEYAPGLPTVALPHTWPRAEIPASAVLAGRDTPDPAALDLPGLARLLHLSAGVVRVREATATTARVLFRAAGSAGGRFPIELYVSARRIDGLSDGVHWYDPIAHALVQVGPPAAGDATTIVATGVPWRTCWRYAERGYRHIHWDAGSVLAQTLVLAESAGLGPRLWTRFPDAELSALVGADGVQEFVVALVGLGQGEPAITAAGEAARGSIGTTPIEFPLITWTQHAGDEHRLGEPWPAVPPLCGEVPVSDDLDSVILRRGSTRLMDPTATVSREDFEFSMAASIRGSTVQHFVAVHGVDGLDPGLYRWPDLEHPVRRQPLRNEMLLVGWDANLVRDAAFVEMGIVDLEMLDDRGYREAQLDSGIVEGRLHLAAYALGMGASGMTFLDSEIEELIGQPPAGLLFTCVGVPTYPNRAGGMPGQPVSIRTPTAGDTPRGASPAA